MIRFPKSIVSVLQNVQETQNDYYGSEGTNLTLPSSGWFEPEGDSPQDRSEKSLRSLEIRFERYDKVVCDELGYVSFDKESAEM